MFLSSHPTQNTSDGIYIKMYVKGYYARAVCLDAMEIGIL